MKKRFVALSRSLESRLILSVSVLLVLMMAIITVAVNDRLSSLLLREARERGRAIAHSFGATTTNALLNYDYVSLTQAAQKAVEEEGIAYVIVLDKEDAVAAQSSRPDLDGINLGARRTEVRNGSPFEFEHRELEVGEDRVRIFDVGYAVTIEGSDAQWGTVRVGLDLESMHGAIRRVRFILFFIGMGGVLLALAGARVIARKITRSLDDLVRGTIAVSRGNLDHRIEIASGDEIATLADHFNHMTEQVKKQQTEIAVAKRELEVLNATLEDKVAKRTQEFLASEEKYRILVDNSPDPILIVQDENIRFVNPAFERLFGYTFSQVVREEIRIQDLLHERDRERVVSYFSSISSEGKGEGGEIRGVTRGGDARIFEMRGMRITYLGEPAVEIILLDTTEKKELQDHLVQHEKLRALGELASGVAHDFNNILGIILGRSQLLQRNVDDLEVRRGLRTIERAAHDGGETVRRIQDFARARTERNFEDIRLNDLLEEVVEITRTRWKDQAEVRNVKIDVDLELSALENVKGSASELREVYTNLIFNAVDAMPQGGRITIRSYMEHEYTVVEVQDDGGGMEDFVRSRIFDPFFTTKGTKGMGLGMSVVYGIIERHNGKIQVESDVGKGTCFMIRIPATSSPASPAAEESTVSSPQSAKVLVVDDEQDILELVSDILDAGGHEVVTADSGPKALEQFRKGKFDLLFCDLGMREMSGWEVVSAIRAQDPQIAAVLLTGWGATLSEEKVREYGIDAVLNKPFDMQKLLRTVVDVLDGRGAVAD